MCFRQFEACFAHFLEPYCIEPVDKGKYKTVTGAESCTAVSLHRCWFVLEDEMSQLYLSGSCNFRGVNGVLHLSLIHI